MQSRIVIKAPPEKSGDDEKNGMLSGPELQRRWGVSYDTLLRLRRAGDGPPAYRLGRNWRYRVEDVEQYESSLERAGGAA